MLKGRKGHEASNRRMARERAGPRLANKGRASAIILLPLLRPVLPLTIPPDQEKPIFRAVQEGLTDAQVLVLIVIIRSTVESGR